MAGRSLELLQREFANIPDHKRQIRHIHESGTIIYSSRPLVNPSLRQMSHEQEISRKNSKQA